MSSAAGVTLLGCRARLYEGDQRAVAKVVAAVRTRDGAGVSLRRALGSAALPMLDPFLLLDEIHSDRQEDWQAGFPRHPHRGFETVSILLAGAFEHRDILGNHGVIGAGGVQWMTAGHGIIHEEMPRAQPGQDLWGLQLWVNLPASHKMTAPRYQDLDRSTIPARDGVRVIAGGAHGLEGPVSEIVVAPTLVDATIPARGELRFGLPAGHAAFAYALAGELALGTAQTRVRAGELAALSPGPALVARSAGGGRLLLVAARPLGEPVARRGPFVMNTQAELDQAFADYRSGRLVR